MRTDRSIRVGVTGHRFLAEVDRLTQAVEQALERIQSAFEGVQLACISPLAEGADRLVADAVLERGGRLIATLPFAGAEYLKDFDSEASKRQFLDLLGRAAEVVELPCTENRNDAYEQVGLYVLDNSDVVVAVYDGEPAQGRGGTADIVRRALESEMPVLHIKAGNRKPGTDEPTSLGDEQGKLVVHNL